MASGRPLNILSSLDEAEKWHKQLYIRGIVGCQKNFKPFGLDTPPYLGSRNNSPGPPWAKPNLDLPDLRGRK